MVGWISRALLVSVSCGALVGCTSKAERIETSLRKGTQYVRQSEWDKAGIEARNVLQMDPKNAGGYLIAAQVEDGRGSIRNAYANYSKVLELQPASVDAKLGLARLYLLSGDLSKSRPLIDGVLQASPSDARALAFHAALLSRQGDRDKALAEADHLVASGASLPVDATLALAGLYFNVGKADAALGVIDSTLQSMPADMRLLEMGGEVAASGKEAGASARADTYYKRALAAAPDNTALWNEWAAVHVHAKDIGPAEDILRKAIQARPDDTAREVSLLQFMAAYRSPDQAEQEWLSAIKEHAKDGKLRLSLADFYRLHGRTDDAGRTLQAVIDQDSDTAAAATARGQLAGLEIDGGHPDEAKPLLAALLKANPHDDTGLALRGRLELGEGDAQSAIIDLRAALKDQPGSTEVAALLSRAHRVAGEPQLAREVLADVVKFNTGNPKAHLLLAADMSQAREFKAELPELDAALKIEPANVVAHQMKVECLMSMSDFEGAETDARALIAKAPRDPAGNMLLGRVMSVQKRLPAALAAYDAAAAVAPQLTEPVVAAVGLLVAEKRYDEAGRRVDALLQAQPQSLVGRELRGELALARGDLAGADTAFSQLVEAPGAPATAFKNLAAVKAARSDLAGTLAALERGEKAYPDNRVLPAAQAEWLGRAGRIDDAIAVYDALLKRAPDDDLAANNLAYVLAERKRDPASLDRALKLANRFAWSDQAGFVDTLGLVQYRLGRFDQASNLLQRAAQLAPADANVQLHYGMALIRKGDVGQGTEILRKALASKTPLPDHDEAQALIGHA